MSSTTTFHTGADTHPAVLPQRQALEPAAADNPGSRDETGRRGATSLDGAAGMGHGRGETVCMSPARVRRHPDAAASVAAEGVHLSRKGESKTGAGAQMAVVPTPGHVPTHTVSRGSISPVARGTTASPPEISYVRSSHAASTREPTPDASPSAPTGATAFPSQAAMRAPATRTCACSNGLTDTRTAPGSKKPVEPRSIGS